MHKYALIFPFVFPATALALDLEAISNGLVEASPWGQNPEILPFVFGWLGVIVVLAIVAKALHLSFDTWRGWLTAQKSAQLGTEQWILDMGELLHVRPPPGLKRGSPSRDWQKYRHQVKQALLDEIQRGRQLAAQLHHRDVG